MRIIDCFFDDVSILRCVFSWTSNYYFRSRKWTHVINDWSQIQKCRPVPSEIYCLKSNYGFTDRKWSTFSRQRKFKKLKSTSSPKSLQNTKFWKKLLIFRKNRWFWKKRNRKSMIIFFQKNTFSNLGLGYAIIGQKHVCLHKIGIKILQKDTSKSIDSVFYLFL